MIDEDHTAEHPQGATILRGDPRLAIPARRPRLSGDGKTLMIAVLAVIVVLLLVLMTLGSWVAYRAFNRIERDEAARERADRPPPPPHPMSMDPADWISADDYPPDALRHGDEGVVRIRWFVAADGRVSACRIMDSSGHASLDRAACGAIVRSGRYPATPIGTPPRTFERQVVWNIPH